jgi:hypothetical protein
LIPVTDINGKVIALKEYTRCFFKRQTEALKVKEQIEIALNSNY